MAEDDQYGGDAWIDYLTEIYGEERMVDGSLALSAGEVAFAELWVRFEATLCFFWN